MTTLDHYSKAVDVCVEIMNHVKDERERRTKVGEYVNVFTLWNSFSGISEPIHSRILAFFLSSDPMHGQGNLFLNLFLKQLGIQSSMEEEWVVTAEKGRVDVMLTRYHPQPSVVIIENKSNWAGDQPNQLYRYWVQNIHRTEDDCHKEFYEKHREFQIVYLVPNNQKRPSDNSLERPSGFPSSLPDKLPIKPVEYAYNKELVDWLNECISSLSAKNTPLINLLTQYKEYCKYL